MRRHRHPVWFMCPRRMALLIHGDTVTSAVAGGMSADTLNTTTADRAVVAGATGMRGDAEKVQQGGDL